MELPPFHRTQHALEQRPTHHALGSVFPAAVVARVFQRRLDRPVGDGAGLVVDFQNRVALDGAGFGQAADAALNEIENDDAGDLPGDAVFVDAQGRFTGIRRLQAFGKPQGEIGHRFHDGPDRQIDEIFDVVALVGGGRVLVEILDHAGAVDRIVPVFDVSRAAAERGGNLFGTRGQAADEIFLKVCLIRRFLIAAKSGDRRAADTEMLALRLFCPAPCKRRRTSSTSNLASEHAANSDPIDASVEMSGALALQGDRDQRQYG